MSRASAIGINVLKWFLAFVMTLLIFAVFITVNREHNFDTSDKSDSFRVMMSEKAAENIQQEKHELPKEPETERMPTPQPVMQDIPLEADVDAGDTGIAIQVSEVKVKPADLPSISAPVSVPSDAVYNLSDLDNKPRQTVNVRPDYPRYAVNNRIEGSVTVSFTLDRQGNVVNPQAVKSDPPNVFENSALAAVRKWKFTPAIKGGEAVNVRMVVVVNFTLERF
ncbi:hypothetical protein ADMFC3_25790 [Geovibrio sp. ADMFC3]